MEILEALKPSRVKQEQGQATSQLRIALAGAACKHTPAPANAEGNALPMKWRCWWAGGFVEQTSNFFAVNEPLLDREKAYMHIICARSSRKYAAAARLVVMQSAASAAGLTTCALRY